MTENEPVDLHDMVDRVRDEASFLEFLLALAEDWEDEQLKEEQNPSSPYDAGANGWENGSIGTYLDAAHRCWTDQHDTSKISENPWHRAALILLMGKTYE